MNRMHTDDNLAIDVLIGKFFCHRATEVTEN